MACLRTSIVACRSNRSDRNSGDAPLQKRLRRATSFEGSSSELAGTWDCLGKISFQAGNPVEIRIVTADTIEVVMENDSGVQGITSTERGESQEQVAGAVSNLSCDGDGVGNRLARQLINDSAVHGTPNRPVTMKDFLQHFSIDYRLHFTSGNSMDQRRAGLLGTMLRAGGVHEDVRVNQDQGRSRAGSGVAWRFITSTVSTGRLNARNASAAATRLFRSLTRSRSPLVGLSTSTTSTGPGCSVLAASMCIVPSARTSVVNRIVSMPQIYGTLGRGSRLAKRWGSAARALSVDDLQLRSVAMRCATYTSGVAPQSRSDVKKDSPQRTPSAQRLAPDVWDPCSPCHSRSTSSAVRSHCASRTSVTTMSPSTC